MDMEIKFVTVVNKVMSWDEHGGAGQLNTKDHVCTIYQPKRNIIRYIDSREPTIDVKA